MNNYDGRFTSYHEPQPEWGVQYENEDFFFEAGTATKGRQPVTFADGSRGSFDPVSGAYYDASGLPINPPTNAATGSRPRIEQNGVYYEEVSPGNWQPISGIPQQSSGGGQGAYQFEVTEQRQRDQMAQTAAQNEAVMRARAEEQRAANELAARTLDQRIKADAADLAIKQTNLDFLKNKNAFEEAQGLRTEARATQQQLFTQQQAVSAIQMQMTNAIAQRDQMQAQMQQRTNEFNSNRAFETQQANRQAEEQRQSRLQSLAGQAGQLAASPGDYAKLASTVLANNGWGETNTALAGADFRTTDSLTPLESTLRTRQDVQNQSSSPYSFTPIETPQLPQLNFGNVRMPQVGAMPAMPRMPVAAQPGAGGNPNLAADQARGEAMAAAINSAYASSPTFGAIVANAIHSSAPPNADKGGFLSGARLVGERGIELEIPMGDGQTLILNQQQAKQHGIDLKALSKMPPGEGPQNFAGGGIFDGGFGNVQDSDRTLATNFLADSSTRARKGTPWAQGTLPTPVYASSPGFNPLVRELLASINAQATGVPANFFQQMAQQYAPAGLNERVTQRTR